MCPFFTDELCGSDSVFEPVNQRHNFPAESNCAIRADRLQLTDPTADLKSDRMVKQVVPVRSANKVIQSAEHLLYHKRGNRVDCARHTELIGRPADRLGLDRAAQSRLPENRRLLLLPVHLQPDRPQLHGLLDKARVADSGPV